MNLPETHPDIETGLSIGIGPDVTPVHFAAAQKPQLVVTVDTEEEFDWNKNFDSSKTGVTHMEKIGRFQNVFDHYGIKPVYVIDYPIASQEQGCGLLRDYVRDGRALIGAHLHPWVTPPHKEEVSFYNSYPGNLPRELEAQKLAALSDCIEKAFGFRPTLYKAGRYGNGPNTYRILEEQGFEIDTSPCPPMDFSDQGGPNFQQHTPLPFWVGHGQKPLLCIPHSGSYVGLFSKHGPSIYHKLETPPLRWLHLPAFSARLRLLDRLRLTPEGHTLDEMRRITRWLYLRGARLFMFSVHSTSVEPGHTPYVHNERDLARILDKFWGYFEFFKQEMKGDFTTPYLVRDHLQSQKA